MHLSRRPPKAQEPADGTDTQKDEQYLEYPSEIKGDQEQDTLREPLKDVLKSDKLGCRLQRDLHGRQHRADHGQHDDEPLDVGTLEGDEWTAGIVKLLDEPALGYV